MTDKKKEVKQPLNDLRIKKAKKQAETDNATIKLADGVGGLTLTIKPDGTATWIYRYWLTPTKDGKYTIGKYPDVTLAQARDEQKRAKEWVKQGLNPTKARKDERMSNITREGLTFEAVAEEWLVDPKHTWSTGYRGNIERYVRGDLVKELGKMNIKEISTKHLVKALDEISKRGPRVAHTVKIWIGQIMRFAVLREYRTDDPSSALRGSFKAPDSTPHPYLKEWDIPRFLKKLRQYKGLGLSKLAVEFQVLTFVRTQELRTAKWEDVDFENRLWTVPAEMMKMREPHLVPLSNQALAILNQLQAFRVEASPFIFPNVRAPKERGMADSTILWVIDAIGFKGETTGHGFRSTATTILNEQERWPEKIIDLQLAHKQRSRVKRAYDHAEHLATRREIMQWWADWIDEKVASDVPKSSNDDYFGIVEDDL